MLADIVSGQVRQTPIVYIGSGYGYLMPTTDGDPGQHTWIYTAPKVTGPWSLLFSEVRPSSNGFGWVSPMLHTLQFLPGGGYSIMLVFSGDYLLDDGTGSTKYSPIFRKLTVNPTMTSWLVQ
jgi:hypothetical protein